MDKCVRFCRQTAKLVTSRKLSCQNPHTKCPNRTKSNRNIRSWVEDGVFFSFFLGAFCWSAPGGNINDQGVFTHSYHQTMPPKMMIIWSKVWLLCALGTNSGGVRFKGRHQAPGGWVVAPKKCNPLKRLEGLKIGDPFFWFSLTKNCLPKLGFWILQRRFPTCWGVQLLFALSL